MYETSDFKKGLKILIKKEPYSILEFQHVKTGRGGQFTRTKVKNLLTESIINMTLRSGEKFGVPDIFYQALTYTYKDKNGFHFMNTSNYETLSLSPQIIGKMEHYLIENQEVTACSFQNKVVSIEVPKHIVLKVSETDPGWKGNTVSNATKSATLETGLTLQVPLHIKEGEKLKINTVDGTYIERVK